MKPKRDILILFAKPGLDGHDVGGKIVVRALMEAGYRVVYTGLRQSPEEIVRRARQEEADVLALSILSGSHVPVCRRIRALLGDPAEAGLLWIVGGNIPERDFAELTQLGVARIFPVGTPTQSVVDFIREKVS